MRSTSIDLSPGTVLYTLMGNRIVVESFVPDGSGGAVVVFSNGVTATLDRVLEDIADEVLSFAPSTVVADPCATNGLLDIDFGPYVVGIGLTGVINGANPTPTGAEKSPACPSRFSNPVVTRTFVNGVDIETLSKDECLLHIEILKGHQKGLSDLNVQSNAITAQLENIQTGINMLVTRLDS